MKVTSILSVCTVALATAVSANHGQFDHASVAPSHTQEPAHKPAHHWATHDAREASRYKYTHEAGAHPTEKEFAAQHQARETEKRHSYMNDAYHTEMGTHPTGKPSATHHHYERDAEKPTGHPHRLDFDDDKHSEENEKPSGFPTHEFSHSSKPTGVRNWASSHDFMKPTTKPAHGGSGVAGKRGHHFVRDLARSRPTGNPYAGTRFTPGSAIDSVRGILAGSTGIKRTCDRCVAAMQVGQSLAQQSNNEDFSKAVTGLCKRVRYRSDSGCEASFGPSQVGPYIQTLKDANIAQDGKSFCKAYFNTC